MPPALRRRESGQRLFPDSPFSWPKRLPSVPRSLFHLSTQPTPYEFRTRNPPLPAPPAPDLGSFFRIGSRLRIWVRMCRKPASSRVPENWVRFCELHPMPGFGFECAKNFARRSNLAPELGSFIRIGPRVRIWVRTCEKPVASSGRAKWLRLCELVLQSGIGFVRAKSPRPAAARAKWLRLCELVLVSGFWVRMCRKPSPGRSNPAPALGFSENGFAITCLQ